MPTVVETGAASPILVRLDTHEVSEGETDAEGLDQTLEHNPERFVVAVEVADHAEQNSGDDGFGRKAL